MLRLEATPPASLPALSSFLEADAGFTARAFISAGHYVTSPVTSRPSIGQITLVFRAGHAEGIPIAFSGVASRSLEELGLHIEMHRLQFSWPIPISWKCDLPILIFTNSDFISKNYH